ncbi:hypothetical protein D3C78_1882070 [compost metagenome]
MIIGEPNCQMLRMMSVHSEVLGLEIQLGPMMSNMARNLLTRPSPAKIWRHRMAMATDAPSRLGR